MSNKNDTRLQGIKFLIATAIVFLIVFSSQSLKIPVRSEVIDTSHTESLGGDNYEKTKA